MNAIDSLMQSLVNEAIKTKNSIMVSIPGWSHDLITSRLRGRGVVFNMRKLALNDEDFSDSEEGQNKEGKWFVKTERFGSNPHSVVIFKLESSDACSSNRESDCQAT